LEKVIKLLPPGEALELGAGSGIDAAFLIKHGWTVTAEDVIKGNKLEILRRLNKEEKDRLIFSGDSFKDFKFEKEKYNFVYGYFSLSFCEKEFFPELVEKIANSLKPGGLFHGNLFGPRDGWAKKADRKHMTFMNQEQIRELFGKYFYMRDDALKEREYDAMQQNGTPKHWHVIWISAKKK